jgi:hypothetical protein
VAFESQADNLVAGVGNGLNQIFVHDRQTGTTAQVSVDSGPIPNEGDRPSNDPAISGDGRYVAFESQADNLIVGDTNVFPFSDLLLHDRQTGTTTLVSVDWNGIQGDGPSSSPSISADGRYVAFESGADLVAGDISFDDIFVRDLLASTTILVSVDSNGLKGNGDSYAPSISSDGRYVAFESSAPDLVAPVSNGSIHIFVHDRDDDENGTYDEAGGISTAQVSVDSAGTEGDFDSRVPSISEDGRYVAFESDATNLVGVGNDTNGGADVFVHDLQTGITTRVSVDSAGTEGDASSGAPSISADGRYVAFESDATNLVAGDGNGSTDVFVHDRDTDGDGLYDEPGEVSTTRVSKDLAGVEGNDNSNRPSISADGSSVTFQSDADNLVAGDMPFPFGFRDIFVDDLQPAAGGGGGGGSNSGGGGCFISTAADGVSYGSRSEVR